MKKRIAVFLLLGALLSVPSVNVHAQPLDKDVGAVYAKAEKKCNLNNFENVILNQAPVPAAAEVFLLESYPLEYTCIAAGANDCLELNVPVITRLEVPKVANTYNLMTPAETRSCKTYKSTTFHLPDKV